MALRTSRCSGMPIVARPHKTLPPQLASEAHIVISKAAGPGREFRSDVVGASLLPVALRFATARRSTAFRKQLRHRSSVVNRRDRAGNCEILEDKITQLERQANLLKEQASQLEEEQRESIFRAFDVDSSGAVDLKELQFGWKAMKEIELDKELARRLLEAHDKNRNGVLEYEEFCMQKLEATLRKLVDEEKAKAAAEAEAQRKRQEQEEAEKILREYETTLPGNSDAGFFTRLCSVAAYVLPLLDSLDLGAVVGLLLPATLPFFVVLQVGDNLAESIPFGKLIWFFAMQNFANKEEQPSLLRFNVSQALQIDIQLAFAGLFRSFLEWVVPDQALNNSIWIFVSIVATVVFLPMIGYSVVKSIQGVAPRGLPLVSDGAEKMMGVVKPEALQVKNKDKQ
mmetsp:Transcript_104250/g.185251  ORF Transcript_104250/g.185251 Transcript_104250/m.185251 type:complete len:398 (+) Transcript_104250:69-1262(+)|eukprot:CAMPEP_0197650930 /NCGR_PEP_ID=MMETSP1338-20131121/31248_1 /TAXON_ID=43686 ORGANISM="Pelagodinium beii, Strain RCC1491" /NCGR_SAMPLE_ID=MMETSP1338 /ASSEMBLY_ACC=CAM_ASM_000754 /LENGTH=397 /DNA_ID=CAMNT_0043225449 /DNA_START=69 /DNA_END=1262 /DNA_ORIENTATION=+